MHKLVYSGNKTKEISFPIGGIGTGCIGFSGNGALIDWEIFHRPSKGKHNYYSHFSIKAEKDGKVIDARVLQSDFLSDFTGEKNKDFAWGFGIERGYLPGFPHFKNGEFQGNFPIATLTLTDENFPGIVRVSAFNPFIPSDDKNSSIPAGFFNIQVENTTDEAIDFTISFSCKNPHISKSRNLYSNDSKSHFIHMTTEEVDKSSVDYGDITIATIGEDISFQEYWYRGDFFNAPEVYWKDLTSYGRFKNRTYSDPGTVMDIGLLANRMTINSGEIDNARFVLSWNFPNCENYWNPEKNNEGNVIHNGWKHYYATIFSNSLDSSKYSIDNFDEFYTITQKFTDLLYTTTLPKIIIEAIGANLSTLKSRTCLRLEDGTFYGFEGVFYNAGVCEGSCTHVWNYAYALPFLFPSLERSMRTADYTYNIGDDGDMRFRLMLPIGRKRSEYRPCVDGQMGGIIKAYRDYKICGDKEWLYSLWPAIKRSMEFVWSDKNLDCWDLNQDGVLEGRQHHTLDAELFGPSSWLNGFYLLALKSCEKIANMFGETENAEKYRKIYNKGKCWVNENLFNGEYFDQMVDIKNKEILNDFCNMHGKKDDSVWMYWSEEHQELKFQIQKGCSIDQVTADWHAKLCGIEPVFDQKKKLSALDSIYRNNYIKSFRDFVNTCRIYALNDESGVIIYHCPPEKNGPTLPLPYATETMTGFEYQFAAQLIQCGMVEKGIEIVASIRERYDGEKRDPFNEFECGSHYARAMASYSLLLAYSGFQYNMGENMIGFNPIFDNGKFRCFWSIDNAWGSLYTDGNKVQLFVDYGELKIRKLALLFVKCKNPKILINNKEIDYCILDGAFCFSKIETISKGFKLLVE